jgi:hypothetical protein
MTRIIRREIRKRGFFGQVAKWLFVLFNILMLFSFVSGLTGAAAISEGADSDAASAGAAIGTAIGISLLLGIWAAGSLILGLMTFFTRGEKVIIEETEG